MNNIWYTARGKFNEENSEPDVWLDYLKWARLSQVTDLVGLDCNLSELSFRYNSQDAEVYKYIIIDDGRITNLFNSSIYVLTQMQSKENYNFLAVIKNPDKDCQQIELDGFEFLGYELLDEYYEHSALTNCGGFDKTFLPEELNSFGLFGDYNRARNVQTQLPIDHPGEDHALCNLYGIWRHKTIGQP